MKRIVCMISVLCLLLSGCSTVDPGQTEDFPSSTSQAQEEITSSAAQTQEEPVPSAEGTEEQVPSPAETPEETSAIQQETGMTQPGSHLGSDIPQCDVLLGHTGRIRIDYTGNRNSVRYICEASDVPAYPELEGYDAAYFENHALVLVILTENSGSIQTEIGAIEVAGDAASVYIRRSMDGDAGTMDMATWLLWAEVEAGLDYQWSLANAATTEDNVSSY